MTEKKVQQDRETTLAERENKSGITCYGQPGKQDPVQIIKERLPYYRNASRTFGAIFVP